MRYLQATADIRRGGQVIIAHGDIVQVLWAGDLEVTARRLADGRTYAHVPIGWFDRAELSVAPLDPAQALIHHAVTRHNIPS